jgi:hypothetical protein
MAWIGGLSIGLRHRSRRKANSTGIPELLQLRIEHFLPIDIFSYPKLEEQRPWHVGDVVVPIGAHMVRALTVPVPRLVFSTNCSIGLEFVLIIGIIRSRRRLSTKTSMP